MIGNEPIDAGLIPMVKIPTLELPGKSANFASYEKAKVTASNELSLLG
jgi:hypothetical protein